MIGENHGIILIAAMNTFSKMQLSLLTVRNNLIEEPEEGTPVT